MKDKHLILHIPVIYKGYIDFLKKVNGEVLHTHIIDKTFLGTLYQFKPDIAALEASTVKDLLEKMGFENISVLPKSKVDQLKNKKIILVDDEVSRNLFEKYLKKEKVEWQSVFLRWEKDKVLVQQNLTGIPVSKKAFDVLMMQEAYKESKKSTDWWRQIGAVLIKNNKIILRGINKNLPSDYTPYQVVNLRDVFKAGERQEMANTIHAEQYIISKAAKEGISTQGLSLYVTTFPCPVCAKLITCSGIKNVYFGEGGSNFDAKKVLESAGVKINYVPVKI